MLTSPANGKEEVSEKWSRLNFIVGILAILVAVAPYFLNSARNQEVEPQNEASSESSDESESSKPSLPTVEIASLYVSKVAMDIAAVFELEIQNTSLSGVSAHDFTVILDFGRAEVEVCDYTPKPFVITVAAKDKSYRSLEIVKLRQHEKLYIRCLISSPVFNQVIIEGDKIRSNGLIDFQQYRERLAEPRTFWTNVWDNVGSPVFYVLLSLGTLWLFFKIISAF